MKLRSLCVLVLAAAFAFAQEPVIPQSMAQLRLLLGEWAVKGKNGLVEFHYDRRQGELIGRVRSQAEGAPWRKFLSMYPEGPQGQVHADFFDMNGRITHYRLASADGQKLRFVDNLHSLTYEREDPDRVSYRFETNGRITDSGMLVRAANLQPLDSHPKLVRPLSE